MTVITAHWLQYPTEWLQLCQLVLNQTRKKNHGHIYYYVSHKIVINDTFDGSYGSRDNFLLDYIGFCNYFYHILVLSNEKTWSGLMFTGLESASRGVYWPGRIYYAGNICSIKHLLAQVCIMTTGKIGDFWAYFKNSRRKTGNKMNHFKDMKISEVKTVIKVIPDLKGYSILRKFFHRKIELPQHLVYGCEPSQTWRWH